MPADETIRPMAERDALVLKWSGLPVRVWKDLCRASSVRRMGRDDAVQAGFLGLIRAAELYEGDPWDDAPRADGTATFKAYAYVSVRSCVCRAAFRCRPIRVPDNIFFDSERKKPNHAARLADACRVLRVCSLYRPSRRGSLLADRLAGRDWAGPAREAAARDEWRHAARVLPPRVALAVRLAGEGHTLAEIAWHFCCSQQRVQQLILFARKRLVLGPPRPQDERRRRGLKGTRKAVRQ